MRSLKLVTTLCSLFACSSFAHAAVPVISASATVANFGYRLIDLNPDDDVTPWIKFDNSGTSELYVSVKDDDYKTIEDVRTFDEDARLFGDYSASLTSADGVASASIGPSEHGSSIQIDAPRLIGSLQSTVDRENSLINSSTGSSYYLRSDFSGMERLPNYAGFIGFVLSPNTAVVLEGTANYHLNADWDALNSSVYPSSDGWEDTGIYYSYNSSIRVNTGGWAYAEWADKSFPFPGEEYYDTDSGSNYVDIYDRSKRTIEKSEYFSLKIENNTDLESMKYYGVSTHVSLVSSVHASKTYVPAIPEPSTLALTLLGLGGLATAVRRQQRRATTH